MSIEYDIFVKQSEIQNNSQDNFKLDIIMSKKEILENIPDNYLIVEDKEQQKSKTEWRWRFIKLPNKEKEFVEISYREPNNTRKYINKNGEWINYDVSNIYDVYVVEEFYCYK
jgi:hypothetical protein